jgi:hypothetical protein
MYRDRHLERDDQHAKAACVLGGAIHLKAPEPNTPGRRFPLPRCLWLDGQSELSLQSAIHG